VGGADGWPGGWVIAVVESDRTVSWRLATDAAALLAATADCAAVGIDVPIGLTESGVREADRAARRALRSARGRASSVFNAPIRAMLAVTSHAQACELGRQRHGTAISAQTWHITTRIADVDRTVRPADKDRILEVHPEVSFATMAGRPLDSKRTARGAGQRLAALSDFVDAVGSLTMVPDGPRLDDALDALACAWTARRWVAGRAEVLPPDPPTDSTGLLMRIVV
jgi:predicted RNase H-like nuclease